MKRAFTAWLLMLLTSVAWADGPFARVEIHARQPILVGQQVEISVQVVTPNYFLSPPKFPTLVVDGAIVTMPDESGRNSSEQRNGITWAGVSKTYVFVAQQAGNFKLPAAKITFKYADENAKPMTASVTLPASKITVKLPAGVTSLADAGPAAHIQISQSFDRASDGLKVGDALTRTITIFAPHTQAMMIPPTKFDAPDGVRVYAAAPKLSDETRDRVGFIGGHRIDRATYVFEKAGQVTLPAVEIAWFDPRTQQKQTSTAPALSFSVAANPAYKPEIAPEQPDAAAPALPPSRKPIAWRFWITAGSIALLVLALLIWVLRRYVSKLRTFVAASRERRATSEANAHAELMRACAAGDAARSYAALLTWSTRAGWRSLSDWLHASADDDLEAQVRLLERTLFSGSAASWDGRALAQALRRVRRHVAMASQPPSALPALNP